MRTSGRFIVRPPGGFTPFGYDIHFGVKDSRGGFALAKPVTMFQYPPDDPCDHEPMMSCLQENELQTLMDGLWKVGIRPSDIGTPGHLAATKEHLNDFRKLVEKAYDIKL